MFRSLDSNTSGGMVAVRTGGRMTAAAKIAGLYMLFGGIWIVGSDWVVELFTGKNHPWMSSQLAQTLKGFFFVGLTGSMLWAMISRHVTALERVNTRIKESEESWRRMLEELPVPICVVLDGRVVYSNLAATRLLGPSKSLVGRLLSEIVHPECREVVERSIDAFEQRSYARDAPAHRIDDQRMIATDGRELQVQITARSSAVEAGAVDLAIVDVTERNRLALLAKQAERQQAAASIAAGVAHDFNNTFAAILGQATLARLHEGVSGETDRALEVIESLSSQTAGLTRSLLSFARVPGPDRRVRALLPVLRSLRDLSRGMLPRSIDLEFSAEGLDDAYALVDEGEFIRAVLNIVSNARDALTTSARARKRVVIVASWDSSPEPHGSMVLTVADNGEGISPETLKHLFTPFFTTKPVGKGTGLGLMLAKGTVEEHGGEISVSSKHGEGAAFRMTLPLAARPGQTVPRNGKLGTVLVAEDNATVRPAIAAMLRLAGYRVIDVPDGASLLAEWETHQDADVLVLDVNLPDLSGPECLARIRARQRAMGITTSDVVPAILTSGGAFPELPPDSKPRTFMLPKPFTHRELASTVESLLAAPV